MSSMDKRAAPEAPLLAEQLLAVDGGLEGDNHFLEGCVCVATVRLSVPRWVRPPMCTW